MRNLKKLYKISKKKSSRLKVQVRICYEFILKQHQNIEEIK